MSSALARTRARPPTRSRLFLCAKRAQTLQERRRATMSHAASRLASRVAEVAGRSISTSAARAAGHGNVPVRSCNPTHGAAPTPPCSLSSLRSTTCTRRTCTRLPRHVARLGLCRFAWRAQLAGERPSARLSHTLTLRADDEPARQVRQRHRCYRCQRLRHSHCRGYGSTAGCFVPAVCAGVQPWLTLSQSGTSRRRREDEWE